MGGYRGPDTGFVGPRDDIVLVVGEFSLGKTEQKTPSSWNFYKGPLGLGETSAQETLVLMCHQLFSLSLAHGIIKNYYLTDNFRCEKRALYLLQALWNLKIMSNARWCRKWDNSVKSLVCSALETSGGLTGSETVRRDQFSSGTPKHTGQARQLLI